VTRIGSLPDDVHTLSIAGVQRQLPLMEVSPGTRIAVLNILGDTEVVVAAASALAPRIAEVGHDLLVTAEAKSIPLAHHLSFLLGSPYVVLRKSRRVYMGDVLSTETMSITSGAPQTLHLDAKDRSRLAGARVVLVDDVISTGSTSRGMRTMVDAAGGEVVAEAAILTEGDEDGHRHVIALGHLPVFRD
jgi:adenine phosphoribosyltransferase